MNPTGSFKDTGMTAAMSVAVERGFKWVACASTGNTSAAMAAYAARAGLRSIVFIPEGKIAWGKLSQSMDYGALTIQLKTDFDGCVRLLVELVKRFPIYLLNSVNPYRLEGQKTPAMEIIEQMEWQVPEHIIVPGGNLANSSALGKGFMEMMHLSLIQRDPEDQRHPGRRRQPALPLVLRFQPRDETRQSPRPAPPPSASATRRAGEGRHTSSNPPAAGASRPASRRSPSPRQRSAPRALAANPPPPSPSPASRNWSSREESTPASASSSSSPATPSRTRSTPSTTTAANSSPTPELAGATPAERARHEALRKPPLVLEADEDVVLRTLEEQMSISADLQPAAPGIPV